MRFLLAIPLLAASALLAGCGSAGPKSNGEAAKPPLQILADAEAASETAHSVRVRWSFEGYSGDVRLVSGKGGAGHLITGRSEVEFVVTETGAYVKGNDAFWRSHLVGLPAGRWITVPADLAKSLIGDIRAAADLDKVVRRVLLDAVPLKQAWTVGALKTSPSLVHGREAIRVKGPRNTVFVAATGKPYLLEASFLTTAQTGWERFDGWDVPVALTAPPGATTLSELASSWSKWKPPAGTAQSVASAVAAHLSTEYRRLVDVTASKPRVMRGKHHHRISVLAVRKAVQSNTGIAIFPATQAEMFDFCGRGPHCAIATGTPTALRGRLIRREALEAALYTFRYAPAVASALFLLPPPSGEVARNALFFRRSDLVAALLRPLSKTLRRATPPLPTNGNRAEATMIDRLTLKHVYTYELTSLPAGGVAMILDPAS